ncbi:MAG: hypothetical protein ABIQ02_14435 [Saprospiraceae bacterium]
MAVEISTNAQQKYLQKQGWKMYHQLCASISSGPDLTFYVQV